jgi:hypothetical protein
VGIVGAFTLSRPFCINASATASASTEKARRGFEREHNRKVEPNAMGIGMAEKKSSASPGEHNPEHSAKIQQSRHEKAAQEECRWSRSETLESAG